MSLEQFFVNASDEQVTRISQCKTTADLMELAKEFQIETTTMEAQSVMAFLNGNFTETGELSEENLEEISGGIQPPPWLLNNPKMRLMSTDRIHSNPQ